MKFKATTTEERKLDINWGAISAYASRWKPNTLLEIEIKRIEQTTSDPMRAYYFSTVLPALCDAVGYDPEEMTIVHRHLKCTFFDVKPDIRGIYRDKDIPSVFSNDSEKGVSIKVKFTEWVIRKAAENGGYVPPACKNRNSQPAGQPPA